MTNSEAEPRNKHVSNDFSEISSRPGNNPEVNFDHLVGAADAVLAEVVDGFSRGDAPTEGIDRLAALLAGFERAIQSGRLPAERVQITASRLLARMAEATAVGSEWLDRARPELATQHQRERVHKAYAPRGF